MEKRQLRCWKNDYIAVEDFCVKYGLCYGEIVENNAKYSVFFLDVDGDEIQCCLTKNLGDLSDEPSVNYDDIVLFIPLNELDLKTDVYVKLLEYCLENHII